MSAIHNPYLAEIRERDLSDSLQNLDDNVLATLAVAHELAEANTLTEAINAPTRFVLGTQDPTSPEDLKEAMTSSKLMAIPDDSGDARIAEAAREFVKLYVAEKSSAVAAMTDLVRVVEKEDRR